MPNEQFEEKISLQKNLVGRQLSSVEFVMDYLQLRFDGVTLTILTPIDVYKNGGKNSFGEPGFRDELCSLITRKVISTELKLGEIVKIDFDGNASIQISLQEKDYTGPEAIKFDIGPSEWWVI